MVNGCTRLAFGLYGTQRTCQKRAAAPRKPGALSRSLVLRLGDRAGILNGVREKLTLRGLEL